MWGGPWRSPWSIQKLSGEEGAKPGWAPGKSGEEPRDVARPGFPQDRETVEKSLFFHVPLPTLPNRTPRKRLLTTRFFVVFPDFLILYYDGFLF